jgi:hypothetical protein
MQPVEPPGRIIDHAKEAKFGVARIIILNPETNAVGRNRVLEFGGRLSRNDRVECIMCRASLDKETIAEGNKLCSCPGFEKAG